MKITVAIPTKDRKNKVSRLLNSLSEQSIKSFKVLIADASEESVSYDVLFPNLDVDIIRVSRGNLPRQRRLLLDKCQSEFICFIDDDVTVNNTFLEDICDVIGTPEAYDLAGFSGFVNNLPLIGISFRKKIRRALSGVYSRAPGKLTSAGVAVPITKPPMVPITVDYLQGPCMIFRKVYVNNAELNLLYNLYDSRQGRAEDVALSSVARKSGLLKVFPHIIVNHHAEGGGSPIAKSGYNKGIADSFGRFTVGVIARDNTSFANKVSFLWYSLITNALFNRSFFNDVEYRKGWIDGTKRILTHCSGLEN